MLDKDDHGIKLSLVLHLAITISVLKQYDGSGEDDLNIALCQANLVIGDLVWGAEREIIRFFLKRISCTCLKAKYSLILRVG